MMEISKWFCYFTSEINWFSCVSDSNFLLCNCFSTPILNANINLLLCSAVRVNFTFSCLVSCAMQLIPPALFLPFMKHMELCGCLMTVFCLSCIILPPTSRWFGLLMMIFDNHIHCKFYSLWV